TFTPGAGASDNIRTLALQSDGKILIGGLFTSYGTVGLGRVARLQANGLLDPSFDPGSGADDQVRAIAVQAAGSIYIGGDFNSYKGVPRPALVRLTSTGALDFGFATSLRSKDRVRAILVETNGSVLAGGSFDTVSGIARTNFARLLTNGVPDSTLLSANGPNDEVFAIVEQPDGRILIGGQFTEVADAPRARVARLLPDSRVSTVEFAAPQFAAGEAALEAVISLRRT